jgi:hypothetical protein
VNQVARPQESVFPFVFGFDLQFAVPIAIKHRQRLRVPERQSLRDGVDVGFDILVLKFHHGRIE